MKRQTLIVALAGAAALAGGAALALPGSWDVASLTPGDYLLRIHAADYAGQAAREGRDLAITVE